MVSGNILANINTTGMSILNYYNEIEKNDDDGFAYLPFTGMDFYFFGTNYGNSNGTTPYSIYMNTNYAFGFGEGNTNYTDWPVSNPAILFDFYDTYNFASYVSSPQNGTIPGVKYVRIVATGSDIEFENQKMYEIYYVRDNCFQYMQFNCFLEEGGGTSNISNITNGTAYQNTFGTFGTQPQNTGGPQTGGSYVIRSDLNGSNWQFFPNTHLIL